MMRRVVQVLTISERAEYVVPDDLATVHDDIGGHIVRIAPPGWENQSVIKRVASSVNPLRDDFENVIYPPGADPPKEGDMVRVETETATIPTRHHVLRSEEVRER